MAEPFGVAAGAVGITAAFSACVECFEYVQHSRHFGRDYQTELISLDCARLRLTRWGEAVNIHEDPKLGRPYASRYEVETAKNALHQILVLFADTEKISKKYRLEGKNGDDIAVLGSTDLDPTVFGLRNKMKELAIRRQRGASVLKTSTWALYHRSQLKDLVEGIISLVDSIEKIFPAPEKKLALVEEEMEEIRDQDQLKLVKDAASNVDNVLLNAAEKALTGHRYLNVNIKGKAQAGDSFSSDWTGKVQGSFHTYNGVLVGETGKAHLGNRYGGKDLWDD